MIVSVLFLIGLFASISCYLIMLGLSFIGLSYIIVYLGAVVWHVWNKAGLIRVQLYKVLLNLMKFFFDKVVNDNYSYMAITRNRLPIWEGKKFYSTQSCVEKEYEEFLKWFVGFSDGESNFTIVFQKNKDGDITWVSFRFSIELHKFNYSVRPLVDSRKPYFPLNFYIRPSIFPAISPFIKSYSTITQPSLAVSSDLSNIDPNWITGFTDAEGCFMIELKKTIR